MKVPRDGSIAAVIPTRNRPELVLAAIRSVQAQTLPVVEIIVVVDGPDQQTVDALAASSGGEPDPRLRVIALRTSVGGAEARNIGVRQARASWIAFLDDDDLWLAEKLEVQLGEAQASAACEPVISSSVYARGPRVEAVWPRRSYRAGESMAEYLFCREGWTYGAALLQTSTLFASRELLLSVPFERGLKKHQDWDWLLRVCADPRVAVSAILRPLAIFHVEGSRESVGRTPDWEFSFAWALDRRKLFTRRAFAWFLATECAPQAGRAGASFQERVRLLRMMVKEGAPDWKACLLCAAFLVVPQGVRRSLRNRWNRRAVQILAASSAQA
jgi:glycosyltransferase involved in cell wall biosynthesis